MKRIIILLFLVVLLCGCVQNNVIELDGVEVREYQGEPLSSINDFRENSIKGPQNVDIDSYELEVTGLVENSKKFTYQEILSMQNYSKRITLYCVEGWDVTILWEGVLLKDIFEAVGVNSKSNTVIFYAVDGYSTSLPLDYILKNNIMIAHTMNGVTLPPERGFPFQLVAEDKWGYKWIKWITKIELSDDPDYKGYWESRGYSNDGSLDKPYFG